MKGFLKPLKTGMIKIWFKMSIKELKIEESEVGIQGSGI